MSSPVQHKHFFTETQVAEIAEEVARGNTERFEVLSNIFASVNFKILSIPPRTCYSFLEIYKDNLQVFTKVTDNTKYRKIIHLFNAHGVQTALKETVKINCKDGEVFIDPLFLYSNNSLRSLFIEEPPKSSLNYTEYSLKAMTAFKLYFYDEPFIVTPDIENELVRLAKQLGEDEFLNLIQKQTKNQTPTFLKDQKVEFCSSKLDQNKILISVMNLDMFNQEIQDVENLKKAFGGLIIPTVESLNDIMFYLDFLPLDLTDRIKEIKWEYLFNEMYINHFTQQKQQPRNDQAPPPPTAQRAPLPRMSTARMIPTRSISQPQQQPSKSPEVTEIQNKLRSMFSSVYNFLKRLPFLEHLHMNVGSSPAAFHVLLKHISDLKTLQSITINYKNDQEIVVKNPDDFQILEWPQLKIEIENRLTFIKDASISQRDFDVVMNLIKSKVVAKKIIIKSTGEQV